MTHAKAVVLMILVTLLWSMAGVVTRHLDSAGSFEVTFWRSAFNTFALAAALSYLRGASLWRGLLHSPPVVWVSGCCWAVMYTAFMIAITLTTVANVLVTLAAGPLITALFARIVLGYRLPARTWIAIFFAGLGIAWMFGRDAGEGLSLLGTLIAFAVPCASSINFTALQLAGRGGEKADRKPPQDMLPAVLVGAALSSGMTLPFAWPLQPSLHDLLLLAFLGVFQLAVPCLLVVRLSRELPAPELALLALLEVIFGVAWAWLWAGEQPSAGTLTGGALVLGALVANESLAFRRRLAELRGAACTRRMAGPGQG